MTTHEATALERVSHSQIITWGDKDDPNATGCELKWKFDKIDHLPSQSNEYNLLGLAFHKAAEMDGKAKLLGQVLSEGDLCDIAFTELADLLRDHDPDGYITESTRKVMARRLEAIFWKYITKIRAAYHPSAAPENPFDIMVGDVRVTGFIDAQTEKAIIDWKCVKSHTLYNGAPWIEGEGHYEQAGIYLLAHPDAAQVVFTVFATDPRAPDDCQVKMYTVKRTELDFDHIRARITRAGHEIHTKRESGDFTARLDKLCLWCPYFGACKLAQAWAKASGLEPKVPVIYPGAKERLNVCPTCHKQGRRDSTFKACGKGISQDIHSMRCAACGTRWMLTRAGDTWEVSNIHL